MVGLREEVGRMGQKARKHWTRLRDQRKGKEERPKDNGPEVVEQPDLCNPSPFGGTRSSERNQNDALIKTSLDLESTWW